MTTFGTVTDYEMTLRYFYLFGFIYAINFFDQEPKEYYQYADIVFSHGNVGEYIHCVMWGADTKLLASSTSQLFTERVEWLMSSEKQVCIQLSLENKS